MDIGVKISGTAHAILISIAIFGAPIFSSDEENPIQISEVSLISLEEFELLTKENMPVFQSEPEPEVQEIINESDSDLIAPIADEDNLGELPPEFNENAAPKAAEIISDVSNEAPEEPADIGALEDTSFEKVNGADEEKLEIELNENTPAEESTTQIVTEAEEQKSDLVPSRTSKPKSRPKNLKTTKEIAIKPKLKPKEVVEAEKDTTAESILESLKEKKEPEPFLNLTPAQKESVGNIIRNKMRLCWNPPVGVENGLTNVMILGLKFDIDGKLVESPVNLTPNSGVGSLQAFEAARRAVIRCSPYNELDPEIYDGWKELNLKFNPKNMGR